MIAVTELDRIALARRDDAKALLAAARFDGTVAVWKAESRYNAIGTAQEADATAMIDAAEQLLAVL